MRLQSVRSLNRSGNEQTTVNVEPYCRTPELDIGSYGTWAVTFNRTYFGLPHEPKFEHVRAATALYVLVARIISRVVEFVFLE